MLTSVGLGSRVSHTIAAKVVVAIICSLPLCAGACQQTQSDDTLEMLGLLLLAPGSWTRITPQPGSFSMGLPSSGGSFSRAFTPACSGRPGKNPTYSFFVRRGTSSNLLLNFMGGGGCWDSNNCLGPDSTITYYSDLSALEAVTLAVASSTVNVGILDPNNAENPFRDWNVVFLPYCTGDIHIGSNDQTYTDPQTGSSHVIRHRGFDNFLSVMDYLKREFPESNVGRVFVTGQSAGGYGAGFQLPYIKELYYSRQVDSLADASAGATDLSDLPGSTDFRVRSNNNWGAGANVPSWIPGISGQYTALTLGQYYSITANYYQTNATTPAPGRSRLAQYTTAYDGNQRYFLNVMRLSLRASPKAYTTTDKMWGRSDGYDAERLSGYPAVKVNCNWNNQMRTQAAAAASSVYKHAIAPGTVHTISMSNAFYNQTIPTVSGSVRLVDWYNSMLSGVGWTDAVCQFGQCAPPKTEESPSTAINCGYGVAGS